MRATSSLSRSTAVQPCREDCRQRILSGTVVSQHPRHGAVRPPWSATLSIFGCPQNRGNSTATLLLDAERIEKCIQRFFYGHRIC